MVSAGFILLTAVMFIILVILLKQIEASSPTQTKFVLIAIIWFALWMIYLEIVSSLGLLDGAELPPKIPLLVILPVTICIWLYTRILKASTQHIPVIFLTYAQVFRVFVEILIFGAFLEGILPQRLTFEGLNYDILVGISAPLIAYLYANNRISDQILAIWNYASIVILGFTIFTFVHSYYFLGRFSEEGAYQFVRLPYVLLPGFLAPLAIFFHVLSIMKIRQLKTL